jgi:hypothetical protein
VLPRSKRMAVFKSCPRLCCSAVLLEVAALDLLWICP